MIELRGLNKSYKIHNRTFHALKNINLHIQRGEIFGVLGKSGAGKSTLLRSVNLLERPTSGQVVVNGVDLTRLSLAQLREHRHKIGVVFQHYNLLESRSVFGNIALPLEILGKTGSEIQKKVNELLELVGLSDKKNHFPGQLSGGQKQRVGIARALATDPHLLLCDEATSALDSESTTSVLNLIKKINRELNLTVLLITHELEVVKKICDRVGIIDHGSLVEQDTTVNIFSNPQNRVTQQLIQQALHFYEPDENDKDSLVLKLTFIGKDSDEPIISSLVKKFDISFNLRQALIEKVQDTTVGFTICSLSGEKAALEKALEYIRSTSIKAETLYA
jgi:D-methionine transport system ATP-binding protein